MCVCVCVCIDKYWQGSGNQGPWLLGVQNGALLWKLVVRSSKNLKKITYYPAIPLLGIIQNNWNQYLRMLALPCSLLHYSQ